MKVTTRGEAQSYDVVGIARFGYVKSIGTATFAVFDLRTAQELFHKQGRYDDILVVGRDGISAAEVRSAIAGAVGSDAQVQTAAEQDRFGLDGLKTFIGIIKIVLLVFGARGRLRRRVHDLQHALDHRRPALARVRAAADGRRRAPAGPRLRDARGAGARRPRVADRHRRRVRDRQGPGRRVRRHGARLPGRGPRVRGADRRRVAAGRHARHASPPASCRRGGRPASPRSPRCATPRRARARSASRPAPCAAWPPSLGRPAERIGGSAGRLARRNAMRNPGRTAVTASALTIGVALVTLVTVVAHGLRDSTRARSSAGSTRRTWSRARTAGRRPTRRRRATLARPPA